MDAALVPAGIASIFFITTGPCFGFSMRIMLVVIEQCLPQIKDFWVSHALPESKWTRCCEGLWPGELIQTDQKNIPHHRMSCPLYKMGKLTRMGQFLCRDWMGIGQWLVNYCILHQLSLGFYFSRSCFHFSLLFNFLINQLLVCQPMVFTFFLVLPMSLWWCVGSKWTSVDGHTAVLLMQYYFAYFKSYWI